MQVQPDLPTQIRALIARDEISAALVQLRNLLENSPKLDEVILQSGRFQEVRRQIRSGTIDTAEASQAQSLIRAGLLDLLREIEENCQKRELRQEMENCLHNTPFISQQAEKIYNIEQINTANFS